jgi:hypothetical protein
MFIELEDTNGMLHTIQVSHIVDISSGESYGVCCVTTIKEAIFVKQTYNDIQLSLKELHMIIKQP